jgi:GAF domain-containing protein
MAKPAAGLPPLSDAELEPGAARDEPRLQALVRLFQLENRGLVEFLDAVLDEIVALSASRFGYIYYYSEESELFTLHSWSRGVMASCAIANPATKYELARTGLWGEAVRQRRSIVVNDFAVRNPLKRGYPEGHAQLTRYMTIPVFSRGRIVAVVAAANKAAPYTAHDVGQLTQLMDVVWRITERQLAEESIRAMAAEIETAN